MPKGADAEILYVCSRCKQKVKVFVPATVFCRRCAKPMRPKEDDDPITISEA